jgi:phage terminase small subunit
MKKLTPKQQMFVKEYLIDLNASQAAIRAGYSEKTAKEQASRLLTNVNVAEAVQAEMDKRAESATMSAQDTLKTISRVIQACEEEDPVKNANAILKGCELYGKHHKLFTEKSEVSGPDGGPIETKTVFNFIPVGKNGRD